MPREAGKRRCVVVELSLESEFWLRIEYLPTKRGDDVSVRCELQTLGINLDVARDRLASVAKSGLLGIANLAPIRSDLSRLEFQCLLAGPIPHPRDIIRTIEPLFASLFP
jgi:hypothetical protein